MEKDFLLTLTGSPVDVEPAKPRKREWLLMFVAMALAVFVLVNP